MKKLILTVGLVIVVAATGVSCDRFKAPYPQLDKSSDAAQAEKSASERRAYAQAAQKELDELRAAIADLKSKAESANQETQGKLLIRPDEVSSRITHAAILEVANNPLWIFVEHRHMLVGRLA